MPALAILAAIVTAAPSPPPATACGPAPMIQTLSTLPQQPKKLGDLPDGHLMKALLLKVGSCSMKIVREPAGLKPGVWRYEPDGPAAARPLPTTGSSGR